MSKTEYLNELEDMNYCVPLYVWTKEFSRVHQNYLKNIDLTYTQYIVMSVLWAHDSMLVKEIGRILHLDSGTLTPVLKKLEQKGFVIRKKCTKDARDKLIMLTGEGRRIQTQATEIRNHYIEDIDMDPEVIKELVFHVKAVSEIIRKELGSDDR